MRAMSGPMIRAAGLVLLVVVTTLVQAGTAGGAAPSPFGIYGTRWAPWILEHPSRVGFWIYQFPYEPNESDYTLISSAGRYGLDVIAVQNLFRSNDERFMRHEEAEPRPVGEVVVRLVRTLADPRMDAVQAITLDEENLWVRGRGDYLSDIYLLLKELLPDVPVWQWFVDSPTRRDPVRDRYAVPADGYAFDAYHLPPREYEERVALYATRGEPVVSVLWASPNWIYGQRPKGRQLRWWDSEGWRELFARVLINRRHGVRTAFFMFDLSGDDPAARLVPSYASEDACTRAFVRKFTETTLPRLAAVDPDMRVPDQRPDWFAERCPAA